MTINKQVLNAMQRYDQKLYFKWSNQNHIWEVWRKMPWGDRLITPVTHSIYTPGAKQSFCPLDYRIVAWLYSADTQKKDLKRSWKWLRDRRFKKNKQIEQNRFKTKLRHGARDNYYLINNELLNPWIEDTGWKAPELQSKHKKRIHYRKKYYDFNRDDRLS